MTSSAQRWMPALALLTLLAAWCLPGTSQAHHARSGGVLSQGSAAETLLVSGHRYRLGKKYNRYAYRGGAYRNQRYHHRYERPRYRSAYRGRHGSYRQRARSYRHARPARIKRFARRGYY